MKRNATHLERGPERRPWQIQRQQPACSKTVKYSFRTRFEDEPGTNPEELIAAAHASCFSMALSAQLGERGITPQAISTRHVHHIRKRGR